ncbi:MAG: hypothetical protein ACRDPQ_14035 [Nocardioidaceae bacterium]
MSDTGKAMDKWLRERAGVLPAEPEQPDETDETDFDGGARPPEPPTASDVMNKQIRHAAGH